jgi:hypothetical protein
VSLDPNLWSGDHPVAVIVRARGSKFKDPMFSAPVTSLMRKSGSATRVRNRRKTVS